RYRLDLQRVDSKPAAEDEREAGQALRGNRERLVLVRRPDLNACDRVFVDLACHVLGEQVEEGMAGPRLNSERRRAGRKQDAAWWLTLAEHGLRRPIQGLWQGLAVSIQHLKPDISIDPTTRRRYVAHLKVGLEIPCRSTPRNMGDRQLGRMATCRSSRDRGSRIDGGGGEWRR